mmetsp:Transcript_25349/g.73113  ORF Transcript_25349/g.73113 Transcript_25349/m.73113 type:complete len:204 (-) Transcript_25349:85-696(-)
MASAPAAPASSSKPCAASALTNSRLIAAGSSLGSASSSRASPAHTSRQVLPSPLVRVGSAPCCSKMATTSRMTAGSSSSAEATWCRGVSPSSSATFAAALAASAPPAALHRSNSILSMSTRPQEAAAWTGVYPWSSGDVGVKLSTAISSSTRARSPSPAAVQMFSPGPAFCGAFSRSSRTCRRSVCTFFKGTCSKPGSSRSFA